MGRRWGIPQLVHVERELAWQFLTATHKWRLQAAESGATGCCAGVEGWREDATATSAWRWRAVQFSLAWRSELAAWAVSSRSNWRCREADSANAAPVEHGDAHSALGTPHTVNCSAQSQRW